MMHWHYRHEFVVSCLIHHMWATFCTYPNVHLSYTVVGIVVTEIVWFIADTCREMAMDGWWRLITQVQYIYLILSRGKSWK